MLHIQAQLAPLCQQEPRSFRSQASSIGVSSQGDEWRDHVDYWYVCDVTCAHSGIPRLHMHEVGNLLQVCHMAKASIHMHVLEQVKSNS